MRGDSRNDEDDSAFEVVTVNSNAWQTGQGVLEWLHRTGTLPDVLCFQETRLKSIGNLSSAKAWARARGYDMSGDLAAATGPGLLQSSAGVAIAVSHHIPVSTQRPECFEGSTTRLCARCLSVWGGVPLIAISVYLVTGIGLGGENLALISHLIEYVHTLSSMWFIAGDFNMAPEVLSEHDVLQKLGGVLVMTPTMANLWQGSP